MAKLCRPILQMLHTNLCQFSFRVLVSGNFFLNPLLCSLQFCFCSFPRRELLLYSFVNVLQVLLIQGDDMQLSVCFRPGLNVLPHDLISYPGIKRFEYVFFRDMLDGFIDLACTAEPNCTYTRMRNQL